MSILSGLVSGLLGRDREHVTVPVPERVASPPPPRMDPRAVASAPGSARFTGPVEDRAHERFVPVATTTALTTSAGRRVQARIINVSRTGVAVEPEAGFADGREVTVVGNRRVRAGRCLALGMVFLFEKPLDPKSCHTGLVL